MNLLPKSEVDFAKTEYWNDFFKKRGSKEFEWYGEYPELCGDLHRYIKAKDNILVVGCGNSRLSADLFDIGCKQLTNIDVSSVVIKQMQCQIGRDRPEMIFHQMDALNMTFEDGKFSVVLDKGTLDALMPKNSDEDKSRGKQLFAQVNRVLKVGGRYIIISLLQEHILKVLLEYFTEAGWMIRISKCHEVERRAVKESGQLAMPVFFIVCTKFMKMDNFSPILEVNLTLDGKFERVSSVDVLTKMIEGLQNTVAACWRAEDQVELDFYRESEEKPRYRIHIIDGHRDQRQLLKYGAFIVPLGRETDWLFGSQEGRNYLRKSSGFDRLAVVSLQRDQSYGSMSDIQDELRQTILQFTPSCMPNTDKSHQIPYLTLGDGVGRRKTVHRSTSELSGELIVEEVDVDGDTFRRLVFMNNQAVVQSEVKLKSVIKKKGKDAKMSVDSDYIASSHIGYMSTATALLEDVKSPSVAVIGLGGGGLCMFLRKVFPLAKITGVEIDPVIYKLAKEYFGLKPDDKLDIIIQDGLQFIAEKRSFDVIMFDIDSKEQTAVVSSPPPQFLEPGALDSVKSSLGDTGVFVTNIVCRVKNVNDDIIGKLKKHFSLVCWCNIQDEVNRIAFASNMKGLTAKQWQQRVTTAAVHLNKNAKQRLKLSESVMNVDYLMKELTVRQ